MNADARMTRRLEWVNRIRGKQIILAEAMRLEGDKLTSQTWFEINLRQSLPEPAQGPENSLSVDFTDSRSTSLTPAERDDMSVATGDDWA